MNKQPSTKALDPSADDRHASPVTKSEQTRRRILDAAALVFSRRGFSGARLSDVAKVANMKAGSLYYHFASREELVAEVMTRGVSYT